MNKRDEAEASYEESSASSGSGAAGNADLISVIIPAFNVEDYIEKAVLSVLTQSYRPFEIIIVDDGSTDSTPAICDELAVTHPNIRVFHRENGGLSKARNDGLVQATGCYACYLDGDDALDSDALFAMHKALIEFNADVAVCSLARIGEQSGFEAAEREPFLPVAAAVYVRSILEGRESVSACGKLARTQLWRDHQFPEGRLFEDIAPVLGLLSGCGSIAATPTGYYGYLARPGSITAGMAYGERHVTDLSAVLNLARRNVQENAEKMLEREVTQLQKRWPGFLALARLRVAGRLPNSRSPLSTLPVTQFRAQTRMDMPRLVFGTSVPLIWRLRAVLFFLSPALYRWMFDLYAKLTGKHSV